MKILHTSDWHLGKVFHERSLLEDQKYILQQLLQLLRDDPHDVLLISGDIYDRSLPPADAVQLFSDFLSELRSFSSIKVLVIPGNHDSATRLSYCASLMESIDIYLRTEPDQIEQPVQIDLSEERVNFFLLPFLPPNTYATENGEERTHSSAAATAVERIKKKMEEDELNVLVAHLFTVGSASSDSERVLVGNVGHVSADLFSGFDYVALGHLHKPQQVGERIQYSGSILKYSFSEVDQQKRVLSINLSKDGFTNRELFLTPLREMVRLEGKFLELLEDEQFQKYEDHYVEVLLSDGKIVSAPVEQLRERFPLLLSLKQKAAHIIAESEQIELKPGERTLLDDYDSFADFLYGDMPPEMSDEKRELFSQLHKQEVVSCDL